MENPSAATIAAYRLFADWRSTVRGAGFAESGEALRAFRALHAVIMGGGDTRAALRVARAALESWSANHETVAAACAPVLALVAAELAEA